MCRCRQFVPSAHHSRAESLRGAEVDELEAALLQLAFRRPHADGQSEDRVAEAEGWRGTVGGVGEREGSVLQAEHESAHHVLFPLDEAVHSFRHVHAVGSRLAHTQVAPLAEEVVDTLVEDLEEGALHAPSGATQCLKAANSVRASKQVVARAGQQAPALPRIARRVREQLGRTKERVRLACPGCATSNQRPALAAKQLFDGVCPDACIGRLLVAIRVQDTVEHKADGRHASVFRRDLDVRGSMADAHPSSARGRPKAHVRSDRLLPQHCGRVASSSSGVLLRTQTNVIDQQRGCCACIVDDLLKCAARATETLSRGEHVQDGILGFVQHELLIFLPFIFLLSSATRAPTITAQSAGGSRDRRNGRNRCSGAPPSRCGGRVKASSVASKKAPPSRGGRAPSRTHGFNRNICTPAAASRPCRRAAAFPTRLRFQLRARIRHQTEQACWDDRLELPRRRRIERKRPWTTLCEAWAAGKWRRASTQATAQVGGLREQVCALRRQLRSIDRLWGMRHVHCMRLVRHTRHRMHQHIRCRRLLWCMRLELLCEHATAALRRGKLHRRLTARHVIVPVLLVPVLRACCLGLGSSSYRTRAAWLRHGGGGSWLGQRGGGSWARRLLLRLLLRYTVPLDS
eukprot:scaffold78565_cov69-Phaeocystis_antarctica.AAC.1